MPWGSNGFRTRVLAALFLILIAVTHGVLLVAQEYSGVASVWDLGMGARPFAMGDAFVGLADDSNALLYNSAGLAWNLGLSISSSCEARPLTSTYGQVSAVFDSFGLGVHYFDFGEIPQTDEFGNAIGTFSYRSYLIVAGAGISVADLPFLESFAWSESLALGISAKLHRVDTLESGDGLGFSIDLPFLLRVEDPGFGKPYVTGFSFGARLQDVFGTLIAYGSGHEESWTKRVVIGTSLALANQLTLAADAASDNRVSIGLEWKPTSILSLQCGAKYQGVWTWSFGVGAMVRNLSVNLAMAIHPFLNNQFRGSISFAW